MRAVNVCSLNNIVAECPLVLVLFMKKKIHFDFFSRFVFLGRRSSKRNRTMGTGGKGKTGKK